MFILADILCSNHSNLSLFYSRPHTTLMFVFMEQLKKIYNKEFA